MPRDSPQTERVMAIVHLLTERADEGATLSQIADALGQTRATYVHVLASMTAGGFVVRRPSDRRYHLGPALIAPGRAAGSRFPAVGATRSSIEALSRELGYAVFAFSRDGDHARLVDASWDPRRPSPAMRTGDLLPIEPPLGAVFIAWSGQDAIDGWIARGPSSAATHAALRDRLAVARRQGFVIELRPPQQLLHELVRLLGRGQQMRRAERIRPSTSGVEGYLAEEIEPTANYDVSTVSVPVFGADGDVRLALNLFGFDEPVSGDELRRLGGATRLAADDLARRLDQPA
ncbi:MAG: transcriptional regulator, IclR family [Ilumatobacteraceae bacterium]|nr:transcriptional regulator, IclR family [Ilumatobacteraceae bacterium]